MNDWASRRKTIYLSIFIIVFASISFFVFWKFWHQTPTCFDKIQNGDERGVDCGGTCSLICSGDAIAPIVRWDPRLFEVSPGVWNSIVYVENQNTDTNAYINYTLTLYDDKNTFITERKGVTIIPKLKTVGVFDGDISMVGKKPKKATFEITSVLWKKSTEIYPTLSINHSSILNLDTKPKVEAIVKNTSGKDLKNIELVVAIFDGAKNVIASSRTFIESLTSDKSGQIVFTWPRPFILGEKFCEKPSEVVMLIDRSGSMASISKNPPEPLSSVKSAAISFVNSLTEKDKVAVVSFATSVSEPKDLLLTNDLSQATSTLSNISISKIGEQYTNIYEAERSALDEFLSARSDDEAKKVLVLLTDGIANYPKDPRGKSDEDDIKYAESLALIEANKIKESGVEIFTIGLGRDLNESFLKNIASAPQNYFLSPSTSELQGIYKNISSSICKEVPARIEITYKVLEPADLQR